LNPDHPLGSSYELIISYPPASVPSGCGVPAAITFTLARDRIAVEAQRDFLKLND
jgi:hypothetical protein